MQNFYMRCLNQSVAQFISVKSREIDLPTTAFFRIKNGEFGLGTEISIAIGNAAHSLPGQHRAINNL